MICKLVLQRIFYANTEVKAGWPFGTQTGQRSGKLTANYG